MVLRSANFTINLPYTDEEYSLLFEKNEKLILKVFYKELTKQGFSLTVSDAEGLHKISSFENIIELYENLDEMIIIVKKDNFEAKAKFIFDFGCFGIHCLYYNDIVLECFIKKTNKLIKNLAYKYDFFEYTLIYFDGKNNEERIN